MNAQGAPPPPEPPPTPGRVERLQAWLERVNRRHGALGSLVSMALLLAMLYYALIVILEEYF